MIQTKQNKINLARNKRKLLNIKMSIIYFSYQSLCEHFCTTQKYIGCFKNDSVHAVLICSDLTVFIMSVS